MNTSVIKHPLRLALFGSAFFAALPSFGSTLLFEDTFATLDTTNTWTSTATGGGNFSVSGGVLSSNVVATTASQRTSLISKATDFNPFTTQQLVLSFTGLDIGGTPTIGPANNTGGGNSFFAFVGNSNGTGGLPATGTGNFYYPGQSATSAGYVAFAIVERVNTSGVPFTQLVVDDRGAAATSAGYGLSGTPTGLTWTIDGVAKTMTFNLTGATFTTSGQSSFSVGFVNFTEAGLANGSYLAIGAMNQTANMSAPTTFSLDGLSVTAAIPEPSSAVLLFGMAGACAAVLRRRNRILKP
jgi:hypothetical protein